jgi:hypothetical protein
VARLKLRLPPSGLSPQATAMASSWVDLPEPFSPMRKLTRGVEVDGVEMPDGGERKGIVGEGRNSVPQQPRLQEKMLRPAQFRHRLTQRR